MKRMMKKLAAGLLCATAFCGALDLSPVSADAVDISAKSAIVIDADTGTILFGKNESEKLPMASTTKIMTTVIALEQDDIDEEFTVDSEAIKVEGSSMGLFEGAEVTLRELCVGMMLPSGNDAANAAAVRISGSIDEFVRLMNKKAKEIGLRDTHFVTPSGLDDDTDEHYSTAYDMAVLMKYALKIEDFRTIISTEQQTVDLGESSVSLHNSNKLLGSVSGIIGGKTGFTDKAGRCLVTACERGGAELICVTLNAPDDWSDHTTLFNSCFGSYETVCLSPEKDSFKLPVVGGETDYVTCKCESVTRDLFSGNIDDIEQTVVIKPFYYATVKKGDILGEVRFYQGDALIASSPIKATENVSKQSERQGILQRIETFLKNLF